MEDDSFIFAENLPIEWSFMEFDVPVISSDQDVHWVNCRVEREEISRKTALMSLQSHLDWRNGVRRYPTVTVDCRSQINSRNFPYRESPGL